MPFRTNVDRTTVHIIVPVDWPMRIYEATLDMGLPSNTRFIQEAIAHKLAVDDVEYAELLATLDEKCPTRNMRHGVLAGNTNREVR